MIIERGLVVAVALTRRADALSSLDTLDIVRVDVMILRAITAHN
jgi:hypothetical protein